MQTIKLLSKVLSLGVFILLFAYGLPILLFINREMPGWLLGGFIWTLMLLTSLVFVFWFSRGSPHLYGFHRGVFTFQRKILLWVVPMSIVSVVQFIIDLKSGSVPLFSPMDYIESIGLVWVFSSIAEQVLVCSLLQTMLDPLKNKGFTLANKLFISVPVPCSTTG